MHGLIYCSFQNYMTDSYGGDAWLEVAARPDISPPDFEAMLSYDDALASPVLDSMGDVLRRERGDLMEDVGAYLVLHPNTDSVRRLLRFGGMNFADFLHFWAICLTARGWRYLICTSLR